MRLVPVIRAAAAAVLLTAVQTAQAAERYVIDGDHSNIVFMINHLGYSTMIGQFGTFAGRFDFDQANVGNSRISVTIESASVDTDHEARDNHLRSPDFFNAAEFPEITFASTGIEKTGGKTGRITGDLTMLGVTKPVTLDVTFNRSAPHPLPQYKGVVVAGFSARGTVRRSDFGMKYAVPAVGDDITLLIEVEGHKQ